MNHQQAEMFVKQVYGAQTISMVLGTVGLVCFLLLAIVGLILLRRRKSNPSTGNKDDDEQVSLLSEDSTQ